MKALMPIPVSRAKTAWGLLQSVKRAILADPRRADMRIFLDQPVTGIKPACGTVGCFAGWVGLLAGVPYTAVSDIHGITVSDVNDITAISILGSNLNYYTVGPENSDYVFNSGDGDACKTTSPRTVAHARAVVARIKRFMQVNKAKLKARKLPPIPNRARLWKSRDDSYNAISKINQRGR